MCLWSPQPTHIRALDFSLQTGLRRRSCAHQKWSTLRRMDPQLRDSWVLGADMESFRQRDPWFQGPSVCSRMRNTGSSGHILLAPVGKDTDGKEPEKHSVKCRAQSSFSGRADV